MFNFLNQKTISNRANNNQNIDNNSIYKQSSEVNQNSGVKQNTYFNQNAEANQDRNINQAENKTNINSNQFVNKNENVRIKSNAVINFDALQMARKDLAGEIFAIIEYDDHIHKSNVEIAKATWEDIRNEELVHMGELLGLITYLAPYQKELIESGLKEFEERLNNMKH